LVVTVTAMAMGIAGLAATRAHGFALNRSTCDLYSSPSGDDATGDGSYGAPFRTAQKLVDSVSADLTVNKGCLLPGEYDESLVIRNVATKAAPIFLESDCCGVKDRATLRGSVVVDPAAQHVVVTNLNIIGSGYVPAVTVNGDAVDITRDDISNAGGAGCVVVGSARAPTTALVATNLLHDCGAASQPAVRADRAGSLRVSHNYIYGNSGTALVIGPGVRQGHISRNLMYGNGEGVRFVGDSSSAPTDAVVTTNIISNSQAYNVARDYPGPAGTGNTITSNCLDRSDGAIQPGQPDVAGDNTFASPAYQDPGHPPNGFAISPNTACRNHGPLAEPGTIASSTFFDPRRRVVDETNFRMGIEPTWQFPTYHFEWGPGANLPTPLPNSTPEAPAIGGIFDDPGRPYLVTQSVSDLEPSGVYTFSAVVSGAFGRVRSNPQTVTLPPPIPLRPSYRVQLVQSGLASRKVTRVAEIRVSHAPVGAVVTASCRVRVRGCPAHRVRRTVRSRSPLKLFVHHLFGAGAQLVLTVEVVPETFFTNPAPPPGETPDERGVRLSHEVTRATRTTYRFRRSRPPLRSETCVSSVFGQFTCLQISASTTGSTVRFVRVRGVPPLATVRYVCRARGCPHRARSIVTSRAARVEFPEFRQRKLKPGGRLEIFVTRPKTIGVAALIYLRAATSRRQDGCTTVGSGTRIVPPTRCPFG
jgi:hypothetical protein